MPKSASRPRKKPAYTPQQRSSAPELSKSWYAPVCVGLLILGLVWVVVTYISEWTYPIPDIRAWNLAIGFSIMMLGFVMLMRWR
ncbi:MAG: cell division protein CrgA [Beutenbergiaceae bacterium]